MVNYVFGESFSTKNATWFLGLDFCAILFCELDVVHIIQKLTESIINVSVDIIDFTEKCCRPTKFFGLVTSKTKDQR